MLNQPQSATVKSLSTKNGRKKGFDFSFGGMDKIDEKNNESGDNKKKGFFKPTSAQKISK